MLLLLNTAFASERASASSHFASALADLKREQAEINTLGTTTTHLAKINDDFFNGIALETLGVRELAEIARLNAFTYSQASEARAKAAVQQLALAARATDLEGALAASLRVMIDDRGNFPGTERTEFLVAALDHPAFVPLLQSEFGDIALYVACRAGLRSEKYRDFVAGLPGKLDARKSSGAVDGLSNFWSKVESGLPEGGQRQTLRQQIADYLSAALANDASITGRRRTAAENLLTKLNSSAARGISLIGKTAPELNFIWTSGGGWKRLSDLRGKVVVLDFWATWCGACLESFPKVARLTEHYRGTDVVVLGVTSLQGAVFGLGKTIDCRGDEAKELGLMPEFMRAKSMTWPVAFSREKVMNPDYGIDGIPNLVIVAPDGTVRYQVAGLANETTVQERIDAVVREFKLQAPAGL